MKSMLFGLMLVAALALSACGGEESTGSQVQAESTAAAADDGGRLTPLEKEIAKKSRPRLEVPDGPPPKKLIIRDLQVGHGPKARKGDEVTIHYRAINWLSRPYADSWDYDGPPTIELGNSPSTTWGLDLGVRGMQVGGRRELIIPPTYINPPGDPGSPELGPANTLTFKVDLFAISR